jgi:hypothetical protein
MTDHIPCEAVTQGRGARQCTFVAVSTVQTRQGHDIHLCRIHRNQLADQLQVTLTDQRILANTDVRGPRIVYLEVPS